MEKLEMTREKDLRIYCFSLRSRLPYASPVPDHAHFYLGYSLDDVHNSVMQRFGGNLDIVMHGNISFKEMSSKVEIFNTVMDVPPLPLDIFRPGTIIPAVQTPEMNQMQFVNGLRLVADRFVDAEDRQKLKDIIDKIGFIKKVAKNE